MGEGSAPGPPPQPPSRRWRVVAIVAGLLLLALGGWIWWERPAWKAAGETRRALAAGRYDDAWRAVGRWLKLRPGSAAAQFYRAKAALARKAGRDDLADGLTPQPGPWRLSRRQARRAPGPDRRPVRPASPQALLRCSRAGLRRGGEPDPMVRRGPVA